MQNFENNYTRRRTPLETKKKSRIPRGLILVGGIVIIILIAFSLNGAKHNNLPAKVIAFHKVSKQSVCIDPGHGGQDPGAQSGNLTEAILNLQVSFLVRQELEAKGYPVYMTRTTDTTLTHLQRAQFCNAHNATILVAIHQNAFPSNNADYSTALRYKPQDGALANSLANAAGQELGLSVTPASWFEGGVLMHSTMPATLIESLFITNNHEAYDLTHGSTRLKQEAQGIVNGIVNYFQAHP